MERQNLKEMMDKLRLKYQSLSVQLRASFWFVVCSFLQRAISVITTPIFTRILSTGEYGEFTVFNTWTGIATIIVTLNLFAGVFTQGLVKFEEDRKIFCSTLQGLTLTLTAGWTAAYLAFQNFLNDAMSMNTKQGLMMLIIIWSSSAFQFWAAEQRVLYHYKGLVMLTLAISVMQPAVSILFILSSDDKVTARILGIALVNAIGYTSCFVAQMIRGRKFFSSKYWKYAVMFNLPLIPHYLSITVLTGADRVMIERMVGASEAGIYGLAYSLAQIMTLLNTSLIQALDPWLYQRIKYNRINEMARAADYCVLLIALFNLILIAFAPEAVRIFAPESYYDAIWVIPPVAMSTVFMFLYDLFAKFEFYYEKRMFIMAASVIGAILNIVLNFIFIRIFGYYAAGYTTLFCYFLYAAGHYFAMRHICNQFLNHVRPYNMRIIAAVVVGFMGAGFLLMMTYKNIYIRYTLVLVFCVAAYLERNRIRDLILDLSAAHKEGRNG